MSEVTDRSKAVDTQEFWRERINHAKHHGDLRYSVFRAPEPTWRKSVEDHKRILEELIAPEDKVLDAACGYGRASEFIMVDPEKGGSYMGVDKSPDFIAEARKRYFDKEFMTCDLSKLPFENDHFDVSVCISLMIMVVQNLGWFKWEEIQNELLRVSKNGILCLEYGAGDTDTSSDTYFVIGKA